MINRFVNNISLYCSFINTMLEFYKKIYTVLTLYQLETNRIAEWKDVGRERRRENAGIFVESVRIIDKMYILRYSYML